MSRFVSRLCRQTFRDVSCGFRAYGRDALYNLNLQGAYTYTQEMFIDLTSKGMRIKEVPVKVIYPEGRKSRIAGNLFKYGAQTLMIILRIYRDYYPLRFYGMLALVLFLLGSLFGAVFLGHFFITGRFAGFLFAGFLSGFFVTLAVIVLLMAIAADMLVRIRLNQERLLLMLKKASPKNS